MSMQEARARLHPPQAGADTIFRVDSSRQNTGDFGLHVNVIIIG